MGLHKNQEVKKEEIIAAAQKNSEATRRILRQTVATEAMAADTMRELSKQTEQLKDIDRKVDEIDNHITFSERTVRGMSSIFGAIKNVFTSGSYNAPPPAPVSRPPPPGPTSSQRSSSSTSSPTLQQFARPDAAKPFDWQQQRRPDHPVGGAPLKSEDYKLAIQDEEQRQEDDLDLIAQSIGNLKGMAQVYCRTFALFHVCARGHSPSAAVLLPSSNFLMPPPPLQAMNGELATQSTIADGLDGKLLRCGGQHARLLCGPSATFAAPQRHAPHVAFEVCDNHCAAESETGQKS
jgi:hypothetical protein